jgi:hypothetical protein
MAGDRPAREYRAAALEPEATAQKQPLMATSARLGIPVIPTCDLYASKSLSFRTVVR